MEITRAQMTMAAFATLGLISDGVAGIKRGRNRTDSTSPKHQPISDEERERREKGRAEAWRRMNPPLYRCGRNQPCPCGSGRKFKACCIDKRAGE